MSAREKKTKEHDLFYVEKITALFVCYLLVSTIIVQKGPVEICPIPTKMIIK